jgi:hypothetical protein
MTTVEAPLPDGLTFGELKIDRSHVISQQGRDYILADGLLEGLVQLSRGYYDIETTIAQLPTAENAQTAVVTARVSIFDPESGRVLRQAGGIGTRTRATSAAWWPRTVFVWPRLVAWPARSGTCSALA